MLHGAGLFTNICPNKISQVCGKYNVYGVYKIFLHINTCIYIYIHTLSSPTNRRIISTNLSQPPYLQLWPLLSVINWLFNYGMRNILFLWGFLSTIKSDKLVYDSSKYVFCW